MSITEEVPAALRRDVYSHTRRIEQLQALIRAAEDEIAVHESVLELASDARLVSAIIDAGKGGPFSTKNFAVPPGVTLEAGAGEQPRLNATVHHGGAVMQITWGPDIGFVGHGLVPQIAFTINAPSEDVAGEARQVATGEAG